MPMQQFRSVKWHSFEPRAQGGPDHGADHVQLQGARETQDRPGGVRTSGPHVKQRRLAVHWYWYSTTPTRPWCLASRPDIPDRTDASSASASASASCAPCSGRLAARRMRTRVVGAGIGSERRPAPERASPLSQAWGPWGARPGLACPWPVLGEREG